MLTDDESETAESEQGGGTSIGGLMSVRGGASSGGYLGKGGYPASGGYPLSGGSRSSGGQATGAVGGRTGFGGMTFGGMAFGGAVGGAKGGAMGGAAPGGASSVAGNSAGGTVGRGGTSSGGNAGSAGSRTGGAAGFTATPCIVSRTAAGATGTAGASAILPIDWYVDSYMGTDQGPGTQDRPLRTLECAAATARGGDNVYLISGKWDAAVEQKFRSLSTSGCGEESGIVFANDVSLRAVTPGMSRIISSGYHGICMKGGLVEGIRFECGTSRPVLEADQGTLLVQGSSLGNCANFGFEFLGTAQVTLRPGTLMDYAEGLNSSFAKIRENGRLTVEGGKLSFLGLAFQVEGDASLILHGATVTSPNVSSWGSIGITLQKGSPHLMIDSASRFERMSVGVLGSDASSEVWIDEMTFANAGNAFILTQSSSASGTPKVTINRLTATDNTTLGVSVSGRVDLTVKNSSFLRGGAPAVITSGSGTVTLDGLTIADGWGGFVFSGDETGIGMKVQVRNVSITGGEYPAVGVTAAALDVYDFGTASSPGNNVFRGNNLRGDSASADFVFKLPSGMLVTAVGNTWNANLQGADSNGRYAVASAGVPLDVVVGNGPNYLSNTGNAGTLRLAE